MSDRERWGINEFEVIPPLDVRKHQRAARVPTSFNSTYFMRLWNAGTRTVKPHRLSSRRNLLSIDPVNHPNRISSLEKK
jgi:hypothetical protein